MKRIHLLLILSFLGLTCKTQTKECNCPICPEKEVNGNMDKPLVFDKSSAVKINISIDSNYIQQINSDTLQPHPEFLGCENDIGHEGYPFILSHLDYYLIQEWNLSNTVKVKLLYGEIPKDTVQNEVYYYRAVYLEILNEKEEHLYTQIVGKRMISDKTDGRYEMVCTEIENNRITITTHQKWRAASGRFYSLWSDEFFVIGTNGAIIAWK